MFNKVVKMSLAAPDASPPSCSFPLPTRWDGKGVGLSSPRACAGPGPCLPAPRGRVPGSVAGVPSVLQPLPPPLGALG